MKKSLCILLAVLLACMSLSGCTIEVVEDTQQEEKTSSYKIYSLNGDETELLEDEYKPKEEDEEFMIRDLMQRLGKKAAEGEEINLLPKEVTINSYTAQDKVLIIDFNGQYSKMSRAREILVRAGIVKMFVQIPGIQSVRFTINGQDLVDSKNEKIGEMNADTFVEHSGKDMDSYRYDTFTLYFTDKTGTKLVVEKRNVYYKRNLSKERVVLEQLAKGPMVKGHYPTIPGTAQALDVVISDRICYVNMDQSFLDYALDVSEEIPIYSVVNSILSVCEADKVQISVDGKSTGMFGKDMPLYNFYEKNEQLIAAEQDQKE